MTSAKPHLNLVLHEPEIPPNTGNLMRLSANTGIQLHLIEPLGFELDSKALRRAGLDYHEWSDVRVHASTEDWLTSLVAHQAVYALTTRAQSRYSDVRFRSGDYLLFGAESRGLPTALREHEAITRQIRIPMQAESRSLNLSNAAAIVVYEALRQLDFTGLN